MMKLEVIVGASVEKVAYLILRCLVRAVVKIKRVESPGRERLVIFRNHCLGQSLSE